MGDTPSPFPIILMIEGYYSKSPVKGLGAIGMSDLTIIDLIKILMTKAFLNSKFIASCFVALVIFAYPVLFFPKGEIELFINQHHNTQLDYFFKYITHLGDGSLLAILLVSLLFYNYYHAILTAFSIILQSIIVSSFKRGIFKGLERPIAFFDEHISLNLVDGVDIHSSNTFPSGHTTTGFALFAILFIVINNRGILVSTVLFLLAFLVGLSRVYLLQHFVIDVYFGAIFGIISVLLGLYFMNIIFSDQKLNSLKNKNLSMTLSPKKT